jgi:hypothetical protein
MDLEILVKEILKWMNITIEDTAIALGSFAESIRNKLELNVTALF